jgi:GDP-L-fucose synthase
MDSLARKRITVTGGSGFLGRCVVTQLRGHGADEVFVPRKQSYDLRLQHNAARLYADAEPQILIHLAATVGGIGANRNNPGKFFYENMSMGISIVEEARRYGRLEKLVIVGTTCSYPKDAPTPFREEDLWNGFPEETNAPYGIAKKALLTMGQAYRKQYGLNVIYLIPANLYGPGDNFDPETSHVIPALIRKFVEAKEAGSPSVELWGTGNVSREFLYVEDAAEGIVLATLGYQGDDPVNLGTGSEILIRDLARKIQELVRYSGTIVWNPSQPDGQPRRRLDVNGALQKFGFCARTDLQSGLKETITRYLETQRRVATGSSMMAAVSDPEIATREG